jgi:hypothetical protein
LDELSNELPTPCNGCWCRYRPGKKKNTLNELRERGCREGNPKPDVEGAGGPAGG